MGEEEEISVWCDYLVSLFLMMADIYDTLLCRFKTYKPLFNMFCGVHVHGKRRSCEDHVIDGAEEVE